LAQGALDIAACDNNTPEDKRRKYIEMIKGMIYVLKGAILAHQTFMDWSQKHLRKLQTCRREHSEIKIFLLSTGYYNGCSYFT
jgi:hypothetical protein